MVTGADGDESPFRRDVLFETLKNACEDITNSTGLSIIILVEVMEEIFISATKSLGFYGVPLNQLDNYKILAHVGYWIHRLHPIRVKSPDSLRATAEHIFSKIDEKVWGARVRMEFDGQFIKSLNSYTSIIREFNVIPFNEYVAWRVIYDLMDAIWKERMLQADTEYRAFLEERIESARHRYTDLASDLIWSLRYHNHSARGFAMLVEVLFKVGGGP